VCRGKKPKITKKSKIDLVSDFSNSPYRPDKTEIPTSTGHIHKEMLSLLALKETT